MALNEDLIKYNPITEDETVNSHPSDRKWTGTPEAKEPEKDTAQYEGGAEAVPQTPVYSETEEGQYDYWKGMQDSYNADPTTEDHQGYQDPLGWGKDFVDQVVLDFDKRGNGKTSYRVDDPTYVMITEQKAKLEAKLPKQETAEPAGQTGEAFKEQPAEPVQDQAEAPAPPPTTEQSPATVSTTPSSTTPARKSISSTISSVTNPERVGAETAVTQMGVEELKQTPVYQEAMETYRGLGIEESVAEEMAIDVAKQRQDDDEERKPFNWKGLADVAGTSIKQAATAAAENLVDLEANLLGFGTRRGSAKQIMSDMEGSTLRKYQAGDPLIDLRAPLSSENRAAAYRKYGITHDSKEYSRYFDQGVERFEELQAQGKLPTMKDEAGNDVPMDEGIFANYYSEYLYRSNRGERYNPNLDLEEFEQYIPDDVQKISDVHSRTYNEEAAPNPVNTTERDPQTQALYEMVSSYIAGDENFDTAMLQGTEDISAEPLTQAEIDQAIVALIKANPTDEINEFINISKTGDIADMDSWVQEAFYYLIPAASGSNVKNANEFLEKAGQPAVQAWMNAGITAKVMKVIGTAIGGPAAGRAFEVAGLLAGVGYSYAQQLTGFSIPWYDKAMEFMDKGADKVESWIGKYSLAFEDAFGYAPFDDPGSYYRDLKQAYMYTDLLKSAWKKNDQTYDKEVWDIVGPYAADLGVNLEGSRATNTTISTILAVDAAARGENPEDYVLQNNNEVYRFNLGQNEKVELSQSANDRLKSMLEIAQLMHDLGASTTAIQSMLNDIVSPYMGVNATANEWYYNELTDPMNFTEGVTANTMYAVGKVTGDQNLTTAAAANGGGKINAADFMPEIASQVGKFFGQEFHKSGGFTEIWDTYINENQFGNLQDATEFGKKVSGIDAEGKVKGWEPQKQDGLTTWEKVKNKTANFFGRTNESRVLYATDVSNTFINMGIANAKGDPVKISTFLDQLENPSLITPDNPLYDISQSAIFNTFKEEVAESVRNARKKTDPILNSWAKFDSNRQTLSALAAALNKKPEEVIDLAETNKYNLAKLIEQKAAQNGGKLEGIDIDVTDPKFSENVINKIAPFVQTDKHKTRAPWSTTELSFQISNAIGDAMQGVMLSKYNIQADPVIYRVADTIKAGQNFVFLGISGTYLMNNILNNVVTRSMSGVGGFSRMHTIENYFGRMGVRSERFGDSIAYEIGQKSSGQDTQYVRMQEAIAAKKEVKGVLNNVKKFVNKVNRKAGIFGNLSGKVEEAESKQAIYAATKTYMDRTWKPDVNLTRMPAALEQALDAQAPGMKRAIYAAISNGLNMDEINDAILGDYVQPGVKQSFLDAAAERYGAGAENMVGQLLDKTGMLDELKEALKGKDAEGRAQVFSEFSTRLEAEVAEQVAQHLQDVAEAVKTQVAAGGFKEAVQAASDMVDVDLATRLGSMNQWDKMFTYRLREPMTVAQWHAEITNLQQKINAQYQQLYSERVQVFDGVLTGLGMDDQYKTQYLTALNQLQRLWTTFYEGDPAKGIKGQQQLFETYREKAAFREGEDTAAWQLRAQTAWGEYLTGIETLYETTANDEMTAMEQMDKAFADGMKAASGLSDGTIDFIDDLQKQVRDLRKQEVDLNKAIRKQERELKSYSEKDMLWEKNEAQRKEIRNKIAELQKEMYSKLKPFEAQMIGIAEDPNAVDYNAIVQMDIAHEEAQKMKAASEKYADRAWEKLNTDGETFRPEFMNLKDVPTIEQAETLFDEILAAHPDIAKDNLKDLIYNVAGLSTITELTDADRSKLASTLTAEEVRKIEDMGARYGRTEAAQLSLVQEAEQAAADIAKRVYPEIVLTDKNDQGQRKYKRDQDKKRKELRTELITAIMDIARNGQTTEDRMKTINAQVKAEDWNTINKVTEQYNEKLFRSRNPEAPASLFHTEQLSQGYQYGNFTIVGEVQDNDGKVIALIPDTMPMTEVSYSDDVKFPVLGISPDDPQGIVYMAGDEPRTASPKNHKPEANDLGTDAYNTAADVQATPAIDGMAMAYQELAYKDILPLLKTVAERYEADNERAQTQRLSDLDETTRHLVKSYLDNIVAKDLSNTKFKAMRYGEMMRDVALLNYSDRYGFDNMLTAIAPYQFWMTRSMNQWMKRMVSHPRLYSHYQRIKELEEKNERDYWPSRLAGKLGIPMIGWPGYMGGRTFINPAQLHPLNNFLNPLEQLDDDKHVAEQKAMTLLLDWLQTEKITSAQYQEAVQKTGSVWDNAYAEASMQEDLDPGLGTLWQNYYSPNLFISWGLKKLQGKEEGSHFPLTNVGNATAQMIARIAPENDTMQRAADITRTVMTAPERVMKKLFGFEYKEFGAYADSLISRRLRAMLTDGEITKDEFYGAWLQKDGNPVYERAVQDVRQEQALKVPMFGAISGIEDGVKSIFVDDGRTPAEKWENVLLQIMISPFGQSVYSKGEQTARESYDERNEAFEAFKNGDKDAINKYYDKYPAEETWTITNQETEEGQLRQLLYGIIKDAYYDLDEIGKKDVSIALGEKFYDSVINKETRAIETMPLEDLAAYAQALNGNLPYVENALLKDLEIPQYNIVETPQETKDAVTIYYDERDQKFPAITTALSFYSTLSKEEKKEYKKYYPVMKEYLDWNDKYMEEHKEVAAWIDRQNQSYTNRYAAEVWEQLDPAVMSMIIDDDAKYKDTVDFYIAQAKKEAGVTKNITASDLRAFALSGLSGK